jgi:hypothetical protein
MIATLLLLVASATAQPAEVTEKPTPEQIYAAARMRFAAMVMSEGLRQEFVERADGTFLGTVVPSFEQQRKTPFLGKETYETLLGPWDAVERRIGTIHDGNGKLSSIQSAFGITDDAKTTYLVVSSVDSQSQPGVHACVAMITGVAMSQPTGFSKPELLPHRYGAISGCGLIKDVLGVVDEGKERDAKTIEDWDRLHYELSDKINKVLGIKTFRIRTVLTPSSENAATEKPEEGHR